MHQNNNYATCEPWCPTHKSVAEIEQELDDAFDNSLSKNLELDDHLNIQNGSFKMRTAGPEVRQ